MNITELGDHHPGMTIDEAVDTQPPTVRIRDAADVVCTVPHLLGFHQEDSVVILACQDARVRLTVRIPLDLVDHPVQLGHALDLVHRRAPGAGWLLIGYGDDHLRVAEALRQVADSLGGEIWSVLQVGDGCFWQPERPDERQPVIPERSAAVAQAIVAGMGVEQNRAALWERIAPPQGDDAVRAAELVDEVRSCLLDLGVADRAVRCDALLDAAASDLDAVGESELVELGLLVAQPLIRDIALRRLNREGTWRNVDLWQRVVQTLPAIEQGPVLPVLGIACWVAGEGVMQSLCVERARLLVPNDRLVGLLDQSTTMALPPWFWFEVLDQLDGTVAV